MKVFRVYLRKEEDYEYIWIVAKNFQRAIEAAYSSLPSAWSNCDIQDIQVMGDAIID